MSELTRPRLRVAFAVFGVLCKLALLSGPAPATVFPGASWETRTPEEVALDPIKLQELETLVGGRGMIVRHGYQVHTWGSVASSWDWASAGKPALTMLLFVAEQHGATGIHTAIGTFFPGGSAEDSSITFFQLANMISGYSRGEPAEQAWAYNDYGINLFGHVLCDQVYGSPPSKVFAQELSFLQFEDVVDISDTQYGRIKKMSVRDFARFGLFWLNRGHWDGTQYIPSHSFNYVVNHVPAGLPRSTLDGPESWDLGSYGGADNQNFVGQGHYGMTFWVNTNGFFGPGTPLSMFAAVGHQGDEMCLVIPELDLVAVGQGTWGHPCTAAVQLLLQADQTVVTVSEDIESVPWGAIKSRFRTNSQP